MIHCTIQCYSNTYIGPSVSQLYLHWTLQCYSYTGPFGVSVILTLDLSVLQWYLHWTSVLQLYLHLTLQYYSYTYIWPSVLKLYLHWTLQCYSYTYIGPFSVTVILTLDPGWCSVVSVVNKCHPTTLHDLVCFLLVSQKAVADRCPLHWSKPLSGVTIVDQWL